MRRLFLPLILALVGLLGFSSVAPTLPSAHAQTAAPAVAVTPSTVQVGGTAAVTGRNFTPNNQAYVYFKRPDGTTNAVMVPTTGTGTFSLNLGFQASHGTGNELVTAYDFGTGRWAPFTTIVVTSTSPIRQLKASASTVTVGQTVTLTGSGFTPSNWAYVYFQRPDGTAGAFWTQTNAAGAFSGLLGFTAAHRCGIENVWAYDNGTRTWSAPVAVTVTGSAALAAPSNLRVVSATKLQTYPEQETVALQWQDNSNNETGFRIRATLNRLYGGSGPPTPPGG